jgi:hypothetical protein
MALISRTIAATGLGRFAVQRWRDLPLAEWYAIVVGLAATIATGVLLREAVHRGLTSDFPTDVAFTAHGLRTGVFPGDFMFQILNATFAGFRTDTPALYVSLFIVLALATGVKVWLSARFVIKESAAVSESMTQNPRLAVAATAAALCTIAFCLPVTRGAHTAAGFCTPTYCLPAISYYLGEVPPNVWHNPSTILSMPFAIGLFWTSLIFLRRGDSKYLWWSLLLGGLGIAVKPSFILCFLPVFPLAALVAFGWDRRLLRALFLTLTIAGLLGLQYVYVYVVDPSGSTATTSSGVGIMPFAVWTSYTSDIPLAIFASYFFPIVAIVVGREVVWRSRAVQYAFALAIVGLTEYALLAEKGARAAEGNFTWQAIITQYILLLALVAALVPWLCSRRWGIRQAVIAVAFGAQLWAGVHYLAHWFATKSFV